MLVSVEELGQSDLYPEIISKITRGSDTEAELQLATAEDIVKGYMSRYDLVAIFGNGTTQPTVESLSIKRIIKTIAAWFLIKRANPNVNTELFYDDYKNAIKWLEDVQAGKINLGLPYVAVTDDTDANDGVYFTSLPKQRNFF
jgi:phage gp36-like protein